MFEKIEELEMKYRDLGDRVNDPEIIADQTQWRKLMKEYSDITPIIEKYREYKDAKQAVADALEMLGESLEDDFKQMVKDELNENKGKIEELRQEIKILLLPKDPNDEKNVIMEIRAGVGGDEAALFAAELFRMYARYAESKKWKTEMISSNENGIGGYKEITFMISGQGAYSRLKFESGGHRVQRVPATESGGRIHTSAVTVAVLPEAEEVDVNLNMNDVRIDVFRASGNGGQCVNTTDSAVRITHVPTGLVVSCQDEKSQLKNKEKGLKVLLARLYEMEQAKHDSEISAERKAQVGSGDRSDKIRTYNFPDGRVTDHRIKLSVYRIDAVLNGDLDVFIDPLITNEQANKMQGQDEE